MLSLKLKENDWGKDKENSISHTSVQLFIAIGLMFAFFPQSDDFSSICNDSLASQIKTTLLSISGLKTKLSHKLFFTKCLTTS